MKKESFQKVKNSLNKVSRATAERAFLFFLVMVFVGLIVGGLLFYKYSFLTERAELEIIEESVQFKENVYQKVITVWQNKQELFKSADIKDYPDPFK